MSILGRYLTGVQSAARNASAMASYAPGGGDRSMSGDEAMSAEGDAQMTAMKMAAANVGMNETAQNAALKDYLETGGVNLDPAVTAWCAAYVNASLKKAGLEGTGSNKARSFMEWGQGVDKPRKGDIAVFSRGDPNSGLGHVGFFDGYNPDGTLRILGGNQGNAVSIQTYGTDRLLGFRRANPVLQMAGM